MYFSQILVYDPRKQHEIKDGKLIVGNVTTLKRSLTSLIYVIKNGTS